jgi:hypothetical protein
MRSVVAVEWAAVQLCVKQLRERITFTNGPLLCVRPEETHDIHAVQSNTPSVPVNSDDRYSFHGHPPVRKHQQAADQMWSAPVSTADLRNRGMKIHINDFYC